MNYYILAVRFVLLIGSFYGYLQYFSKKIKLEFCISIIFTAVGSIMFFAGILNILEEMAFALCAIGLFLTIFSIYKRDSFFSVLSPGIIVFAIAGVVLLFLLHDRTFVHFDNYSHWAISTKVLLTEDRFPNFLDSNILFQSYPVGNACFIYYFTKILGIEPEWIQLYAQAILMVGILINLFAFVKNRIQMLFCTVICVFLITGNTGLTDLLVDTLLPITAIGAISFCIYYRESIFDNVWWTIPYVVFLLAIKNSGILFAVIILCYLLSSIKNRNDFRKWTIIVLISAGTLLLWQKHVKLVFENGLMAYHSMSLDYFSKILGSKSLDDVKLIINEFLKNIFSLSNHVIPIILLMVILCCISFWSQNHSLKNFRNISCMCVVTYLAYQIALLGMYLLTMPIDEAVVMAGYFRYNDTILIFIAGVMSIAILELMNQISINCIKKFSEIGQGVLLLLCVSCIYLSVTPSFSCYSKYDNKKDSRMAIREEMEEIITSYDISPNLKYIILTSSDFTDTSYTRYLSLYLLNPLEIRVESINSIEEKKIEIENYNYIIALETTNDILAYMEEVSSEEGSPRAICLK